MVQKKAGLQVRDRGRAGVAIPLLLAVGVKDVEAALAVVVKGNMNRAVRHTEMNQQSSRSHTVLQVRPRVIGPHHYWPYIALLALRNFLIR